MKDIAKESIKEMLTANVTEKVVLEELLKSLDKHDEENQIKLFKELLENSKKKTSIWSGITSRFKAQEEGTLKYIG